MANQDPNSGGMTEQQREDIRKTKLAPGELLSDPGVDSLVNQGLILEITHVPTSMSASFPAFLTSFSDNFASSWTPVDAYGRMDTMPVYQNTRRSISVGWELPSFSVEF